MIHVATPDELKEIEGIFREPHVKRMMPFIRRDYLQREISAGHVYYENDVVLIARPVRRNGRIGGYSYKAGQWHLVDLAASKRAKPMATFALVMRFLREVVCDKIVYCEVRLDNEESLKFHDAMGFKRTADIVWANGTLPGVVYVYDKLVKTEGLFE